MTVGSTVASVLSAIFDRPLAVSRPDTLYDIIVSQPSHPWLAGSGTLFTREFFGIVSSRLRPGGVFGQWVNLFNMDAVTLGAIVKSFYEVFPYGFALRPSGGRDLLLFGSHWPLVLDPARLTARLAHRELAVHLARQRVAMAEAVAMLAYSAMKKTPKPMPAYSVNAPAWADGASAERFIALPGDTRIIDTPGIREMGLAGLKRADLPKFYPDFLAASRECAFVSCSHTMEPHCGVRRAVRQGRIAAVRWDSYRKILADVEQ